MQYCISTRPEGRFSVSGGRSSSGSNCVSHSGTAANATISAASFMRIALRRKEDLAFLCSVHRKLLSIRNKGLGGAVSARVSAALSLLRLRARGPPPAQLCVVRLALLSSSRAAPCVAGPALALYPAR